MKTVYLIGVGMGNPSTLTLEARDAIQRSTLLIGGERLLRPFSDLPVTRCVLVRSEEICATIQSCPDTVISVLLSGDPGFYSGASMLYHRLPSYNVIMLPGISSVNYFCAKLHRPWQEIKLVSAHGRRCNAVGEVQSNQAVFFLTGGEDTVSTLCEKLTEAGYGHLSASAGEALSYPEERICTATVSQLAKEHFSDLSVLLVENPTPIPVVPTTVGLPDRLFQRGQVPMTKESVRTLAISKLRIQPDDVVWDIGAGTGSVSVACALAARKGRVYAVERKEEALQLIASNRSAFGTTNLQIVPGSAPEVLAQLPAPNCLFVGGASGALEKTLACALDKNPTVRVVVTAVSLETFTEALSAFRSLKLSSVDVLQVTAAHAKELGSHHLMMGQNPVWILSGEGTLL